MRGLRGPQSEKDAKLAQKLGQLQRFIAVSPQECTANLYLLGQPNAVQRTADPLLFVFREFSLRKQG
jgi:hypothetical protein